MTREEMMLAVRWLESRPGIRPAHYRPAAPAVKRRLGHRGARARDANLLARYPVRHTDYATTVAGDRCDGCWHPMSPRDPGYAVMRLPTDLETADDPPTPKLYHAKCEPAWSRRAKGATR